MKQMWENLGWEDAVDEGGWDCDGEGLGRGGQGRRGGWLVHVEVHLIKKWDPHLPRRQITNFLTDSLTEGGDL
ncbi:unnamed protein product [Prunus armeniaca]